MLFIFFSSAICSFFFSLFVILAVLLQALICYCNFYMQYLVFKHPLPWCPLDLSAPEEGFLPDSINLLCLKISYRALNKLDPFILSPTPTVFYGWLPKGDASFRFLEAVMRFETLVFIEKLYFWEQTFNYVGHTKTTFT